MKENNIGTSTEIRLLIKLFYIADLGYFPRTYHRYGIKMKEGTIADFMSELDYKSSGYISLLFKKWINQNILEFSHNDNIRGKIVQIYKINGEKTLRILMRIPVVRETAILFDKTASLIIGSEIKNLLEEIEEQ